MSFPKLYRDLFQNDGAGDKLKEEILPKAYLPLTGGTLTGPLFMTDNQYISANTSEEFKGLELSGGNTWQNGAGLYLRNISATGENESGRWGLVAHDASGKESVLIGSTDGLWFKGEQVERVVESTEATTDTGFWNVFRYASGLQIIVAGITIPADTIGVTFTFPKPFISQFYSVAANALTSNGDVAITWDSDTTTSIRLYKKSYSGAFDFLLYIKCAFIGRWK